MLEKTKLSRTGRWLACRLVVAVALLAASAPARGEDADAILRHGIELRRQGRDADALAEFQRAQKMQPSPRIQAQVALAEQALGLWPAAEADLLAALGKKGDGDGDVWIKKNRATLEKALVTIQSQLGTLEVWGTPAGATVYVNDKPVGTLPLAKPLRVAGDSVVLGVRGAKGYLDAAPRTLRVPAGQTVREHVELVTAAAPPAVATGDTDKKAVAARAPGGTADAPGPIVIQAPKPAEPAGSPSSLRPLAWGAGVAAVGALAFGVVETIALVHNQNAFNDYVWTDPSDPTHKVAKYCGTTAIPAECQPLKDAYDHSRTLTIVGYAAGVALAAGAVALFVISAPGAERSAEPSASAGAAVSLACAPDPSHRGLSCLLRF